MLQKFIFPDAQCLERKRFPGELNKVNDYSQIPEQKELFESPIHICKQKKRGKACVKDNTTSRQEVDVLLTCGSEKAKNKFCVYCEVSEN